LINPIPDHGRSLKDFQLYIKIRDPQNKYLDKFRKREINLKNVLFDVNKLGLSCAKLRLKWADLLRLSYQ
jgi:hypothetical protein